MEFRAPGGIGDGGRVPFVFGLLNWKDCRAPGFRFRAKVSVERMFRVPSLLRNPFSGFSRLSRLLAGPAPSFFALCTIPCWVIATKTYNKSNIDLKTPVGHAPQPRHPSDKAMRSRALACRRPPSNASFAGPTRSTANATAAEVTTVTSRVPNS